MNSLILRYATAITHARHIIANAGPLTDQQRKAIFAKGGGGGGGSSKSGSKGGGVDSGQSVKDNSGKSHYGDSVMTAQERADAADRNAANAAAPTIGEQEKAREAGRQKTTEEVIQDAYNRLHPREGTWTGDEVAGNKPPDVPKSGATPAPDSKAPRNADGTVDTRPTAQYPFGFTEDGTPITGPAVGGILPTTKGGVTDPASLTPQEAYDKALADGKDPELAMWEQQVKYLEGQRIKPEPPVELGKQTDISDLRAQMNKDKVPPGEMIKRTREAIEQNAKNKAELKAKHDDLKKLGYKTKESREKEIARQQKEEKKLYDKKVKAADRVNKKIDARLPTAKEQLNAYKANPTYNPNPAPPTPPPVVSAPAVVQVPAPAPVQAPAPAAPAPTPNPFAQQPGESREAWGERLIAAAPAQPAPAPAATPTSWDQQLAAAAASGQTFSQTGMTNTMKPTLLDAILNRGPMTKEQKAAMFAKGGGGGGPKRRRGRRKPDNRLALPGGPSQGRDTLFAGGSKNFDERTGKYTDGRDNQVVTPSYPGMPTSPGGPSGRMEFHTGEQKAGTATSARGIPMQGTPSTRPNPVYDAQGNDITPRPPAKQVAPQRIVTASGGTAGGKVAWKPGMPGISQPPVNGTNPPRLVPGKGFPGGPPLLPVQPKNPPMKIDIPKIESPKRTLPEKETAPTTPTWASLQENPNTRLTQVRDAIAKLKKK